MREFKRNFRGLISQVGRYLNWCAITILGLLAVVTLIDVIGRSFFNRPIDGGYELTELALVVLFAFGLGKSELMKKNVRVDLLMGNLSAAVRHKFDNLNNIVSCIICLILGLSSIGHAGHIQKTGTTSGILEIPLYPFVYMLGFGFLVVGVVFFSELFEERE